MSFDPSGSSDPGGRIVRYDWDFGDGATSSKSGPTPVGHAWSTSGPKTVARTVTDDEGNTDRTTRQVDLHPATIRLEHIADGAPIAGVSFAVYRRDGASGQATVATGGDGAARLVLPQGRYVVRSTSASRRYVYTQKTLVVPGQRGLAFLYDDQVDVRVGISTRAGRGIAGVRVRITGAGTRGRRVAETEVTTSSASFRLPPSTDAGYLFEASCAGRSVRRRVAVLERPESQTVSLGVLDLTPVTSDPKTCPARTR